MKVSFDFAMGLLAPNQCIVCAAEGATMCELCLQTAGEPITPRCAGCKALSGGYKTCSSCRSWLNVYAVYAAVPYEGIYERLVHSYKFDMQRDASEAIAYLMKEVETELPREAIVCQLPTASTRVRIRGFDHAKLITGEYAKLIGKKPQMILARHTNNRQLGSSREQRIKQMKTEFYVPHPEIVSDRTVVIVDDVMTTGASLAGAAKALKAAGARRVYAIVFAQAG